MTETATTTADEMSLENVNMVMVFTCNVPQGILSNTKKMFKLLVTSGYFHAFIVDVLLYLLFTSFLLFLKRQVCLCSTILFLVLDFLRAKYSRITW